MYEERLAEFSRERLGGRPIPDDLRILLVAQWEGRDDFTHLLGITFLDPGVTHPHLDTSYLSAKELADPEMQAINAGFARMSEYVKIVAEGGKGWIGYWLHPDEPADQPWPVIELDTEASYWSMAGSTLAEACAADMAQYQEEPDEQTAFARLSAQLDALGLPLSGRGYDDLHDPGYEVDPEELSEELIDAERVRLGIARGH
ncbi:hypothetical protein [Streptomyces hainanensis]|uniref:Uncharacterized protein n=1 Tax=Streptomyces hainanensis TaxID=402648 RepID=A0A4R4TNJ2_9ACTN|nr:hypothetical protein [Streptomyces hainanensis]TDC75649.1 hypothetical protein E1283_11720 [Streptomyces hainanensis]